MTEYTYSRIIRASREELGISQRQLAQASGVANSTISRIEDGAVSPNVATLQKLYRALDDLAMERRRRECRESIN